MNRGRRFHQNKPFVSGGVYNAQQQQQQHGQQQSQGNQQESQPQRQRQVQQKEPEQPIEEAKPVISEEQSMQPDQDASDNVDQLNDVDDPSELTDKNGKMRFKKIFLIRKKSSVRAREKKIRQNRQLRKAIMPKNALMALNEVKGIQMSDFVLNNNTSGGFTAVVTVNHSQYEGKGNSKASAKNDACEKALRDYVIARMIRRPRSSKSSSEGVVEPMEAEDAENEAEKDDTKDADNSEEQDDVPMVNLASFALFKLFSEWESEGFVVPEMHPTVPAGESNGTVTPKEPKKLPIRTELPNGWESMHPATLLCMMRPGVTYMECGTTVGDKPNVMQKVSVIVDEQEFEGIGRSKKLARRNAAVAVCNSLFGTNFEEDTVSNV